MSSLRSVICFICGSSENEVAKFHCFPKNIERCKSWCKALNIQCSHLDIKSRKICSNHFNESDYINIKTRMLKRGAVPMKWNERENSTDLCQQIIPNSYCGTAQKIGQVTVITPKIRKDLLPKGEQHNFQKNDLDNTDKCIKLKVFSDDSQDIEISSINSNTQFISSNNHQVLQKEQPASKPLAGTLRDIELQVSEANITNTCDQTEYSNLDIIDKFTNNKKVIGVLVQQTTLPSGKQMGVLQILDGSTPNFDLATEMNKLDSEDDSMYTPRNELPKNKLSTSDKCSKMCGECNKQLNGDFAMKCAGCSKEFHNTCVNISKLYFNALNNIDGINWFCLRCR